MTGTEGDVGRRRHGGYQVVIPLLAGLTVVCSSTALAGVITGGNWLGTLALTVFFLVGIGLLLRMLRAPTPLVAVGQLTGLACLSTAMFARDGIAGFLPGPGALGELADLLAASIEVIRTGVPPVEAQPSIMCLAVIAIGLVAVVVDVLVAPGQAPAAAGLMLLCIYAVPASLADELLPWWTFVFGAVSFALLLAVDRAYRQAAWRGGDALGAASQNDSIPTAAGIAGLAMVAALLAGTQLSMIGTEGRLPGSDGGGRAAGPSQLGIKPFTTLRGMLDRQDEPTELFRVRGLGPNAPYLRSLTLQDYEPGRGWRVRKTMDPGVPAASGPLPPGAGDDGGGPRTRIDIQSVNWLDVWLPVYGVPRQIQGVERNWRYDSSTGIVYSQRARNPGRYTEQAMLAEPSPEELRAAPSGGTDPAYTGINGVDPRVVALTRRLTANATNDFDRAAALYRYFTSTGGFSYSTQTAAATDSDALADFVLNGKTGFCEQYASAMAVMLRSIGVPSRVAIGFTPGIQQNGYRSITSQDAHAWVEVFFPGHGWMTFDPTPLSDGRGYTPGYLDPQGRVSDPGQQGATSAPQPPKQSPTPTPGPERQDRPQDTAGAVPPGGSGGGPGAWVIIGVAVLAALATGAALLLRRWPGGAAGTAWWRRILLPIAALGWAVVLLLLAGLVSWWLLALPVAALLAAAPWAVRATLRSRRLRTVDQAEPGAADSAWAEVLAESLDRGVEVGDRETVRATAARLIQAHALDDDGQRALRTLVKSLERAWYSGRSEPDAALAATLREVLAAIARDAPLGWRARLLPMSVLRGRADAQASPPTTVATW